MLSFFRWYRRLLGGTWHNGPETERWGFDAGSMSHGWMDRYEDRTLEQRQKRAEAMERIVKWREQ